MRRIVRGLLWSAVLAGALAAAGCSPGRWPTIGVLLVDDRPAVLAAPCPGDQLTVLELTEGNGTAQTGAANGSPRWQAQGSRPLGHGETVQLLNPPAGWNVTAGTVDGLHAGPTYRVKAWGRQVSFNVAFTLADLRSLQAGEVWAPAGDGSSQRAIPRQEFERTAGSTCGRR